MARETVFRKIDDVEYVCMMMPATVGHKTLIRLTEVVGRPVLLAVARAVGEDDLLLDQLVATGTNALFERLDPEIGDDIIKSLLNGVQAKGVGPVLENFDDHFRGRIWHLYKVLAFSVEVNYRDFFDELLSQELRRKLRGAGSAALTRLTSMTSSGESAPPTVEST